MAEKKFEAVQPNLILVEGYDDQFVVQQLLAAEGITNVQVHAVGSKVNFKPFLNAERKSEGFEAIRTISLIADADNSRESSLKELRDAFHEAKLPVPANPSESAPGPPSVLVECIPIGRDTGALEDVILEAIEDCVGTQPCWGDIRGCLETNLPQAAKFNEARWNKIRLQLVLNCSLRGYKTGIVYALQSSEYAGVLTAPCLASLRALLHKIQAEHHRLQETSAT